MSDRTSQGAFESQDTKRSLLKFDSPLLLTINCSSTIAYRAMATIATILKTELTAEAPSSAPGITIRETKTVYLTLRKPVKTVSPVLKIHKINASVSDTFRV